MSEITIEPTGHYVLVEMVEIAKQSKGGIIFANVEKEQAATQVAKVIAQLFVMGSLGVSLVNTRQAILATAWSRTRFGALRLVRLFTTHVMKAM